MRPGDGSHATVALAWGAVDRLLVRDLSEESLLRRIVPVLPRGRLTLIAAGDDAAVVNAPDGRVVITTDVLVENQHFRRESYGNPISRDSHGVEDHLRGDQQRQPVVVVCQRAVT